MRFRKIASLLVIAALLLSGCGPSQAEKEAAAKAETEMKIKAEADAKVRLAVEAEAKAKAEAEAKKKAEEEAKAKAEEKARKKAEAEKTKIADAAKSAIKIGTDDELSMAKITYDYVVENQNLFPANTPEDIAKVKSMVDKSIQAKHLNKNVEPYLNKMVSFSGEVISIEEHTLPTENIYITLLHMIDSNSQSYFMLMYKLSGDIFEEDKVRIWGIPIGPWEFPNLAGGVTKTQYIFGSHIEKIK